MRKVAGEHPFCVLMYMNSYIFHVCFSLFCFVVISNISRVHVHTQKKVERVEKKEGGSRKKERKKRERIKRKRGKEGGK